MPLDERQKRELKRRCKEEPKFFIEKTCYIIDKTTNRLTRFLFNKIQNKYWDLKKGFDYVIKSRKGGISTVTIARMIQKCAFNRNERAVMLCQNDDATFKMFRERVIPILKNCKFPLNFEIKESAGTVLFPNLDSTLYIGTAGSKKFGRGSDITIYHLSEFAHWEDPEVLTGIEEACMDNAEGVIETTANGINFAHKTWRDACKGLNRYHPLFIPWYLDDTYRVKGVKALDHLTREEQELIEVFDIDFEQLAWRRKKIKDMAMPELFPQEYPATAEEAFISSSKMVFNWVSLVEHEKNCISPRHTGYLKDANEAGIKFMANQNSNLHIWDMPVEGHVYVVGADIAEGIPDGCFSAAFVLDLSEGTQVASYHGRCPPDDFGDILSNIGYFYNTALLVPESWPGCGAVTMSRLIRVNYPNIYIRDKKPRGYRTEEQLYGWATTSETKPMMIHHLAGEGIRDFKLRIRDAGLIDEMRSFIYNKDHTDKMEPQEGCFSDQVMACGIAFYIGSKMGLGDEVKHGNFKDKIWTFNRRSSSVLLPVFKGPRYGLRTEN